MKAIVDWVTEPWRASRAFEESLKTSAQWRKNVLGKVPIDEAIRQMYANHARMDESLEWFAGLMARQALIVVAGGAVAVALFWLVLK